MFKASSNKITKGDFEQWPFVITLTDLEIWFTLFLNLPLPWLLQQIYSKSSSKYNHNSIQNYF